MVKALARWNSVNIVFWGNKNVLPLVQRFIELKAHSTISTLMCGLLLESLQKVVLITLLPSLMISLGRCGHIC